MKIAQIVAARATTKAVRLSQAIRRPAANVQRLLQTLGGPPLRSCEPLPRAVTPCYFELPVARHLSSAVQALSPARTKRFDSCQVQLELAQQFLLLGGTLFKELLLRYPKRPERIFRLITRVPSEVATETLLCRCSYGQTIQSGIKLPLRNFEPVSAHQTDALSGCRLTWTPKKEKRAKSPRRSRCG